jgi:hypothetical protein
MNARSVYKLKLRERNGEIRKSNDEYREQLVSLCIGTRALVNQHPDFTYRLALENTEGKFRLRSYVREYKKDSPEYRDKLLKGFHCPLSMLPIVLSCFSVLEGVGVLVDLGSGPEIYKRCFKKDLVPEDFPQELINLLLNGPPVEEKTVAKKQTNSRVVRPIVDEMLTGGDAPAEKPKKKRATKPKIV